MGLVSRPLWTGAARPRFVTRVAPDLSRGRSPIHAVNGCRPRREWSRRGAAPRHAQRALHAPGCDARGRADRVPAHWEEHARPAPRGRRATLRLPGRPRRQPRPPRIPALDALADGPARAARPRPVRSVGGAPREPQARLARPRALWFEGYVRAYLERDLLAPPRLRVPRLPPTDARRLQLGQVASQTELARSSGSPSRPCIAGSTCWRSPTSSSGSRRWASGARSASPDAPSEAEGRLLPIEVKATARPRLAHAPGLRAFRADHGKACRAGLLLHTGAQLERMASDVLAAPWWAVC
jgi:hypothetical protein